MRQIYLMCLLLSLGGIANIKAQQLTQTIKGNVIDAQATYPLIGVNVILQGSNPTIGTTTDADGNFKLENVPVGRRTVAVTYVGYEPSLISNLQVNSAKEVYLEIKLQESVQKIDEAVVVGSKKKTEVTNDFAFISSRSFTVEEASRYAGSLNDPARMAANFAGIATTGDTRNDIIVRGNSPNGIIYRLEGVDIPNPNHFGTYGASGGYYSMFSQNTLANSDFLTGAFPAHYGNALGGVFDIQLRKGNNEKREYAFTFGLNGIELTAEGPFSVKSKASYLVNYRYSTMGAFDALGIDIGAPAIPKYQDINLKAHIPLKKGYVKIFGLGGMANIELKDSEAESPEDFFTQDQPSDLYSGTRMGVLGASHKNFFNERTYGELTLTMSQTFEKFEIDTLAAPGYKVGTRLRQGDFEENRYSLKYDYSQKLNKKHRFVAGAQVDILDLQFAEEKAFSDLNETRFEGNTSQYSVYTQWLYRVSNTVSMSAGLHGRYFDLTESLSIEPRANFKWQLNAKHSLNAGFGIHSQRLPSYAYFIDAPKADGTTYYKYGNVGSSKSQHYILGYNFSITNNLRLKLDGYYQNLYDVAVEKTPSYWSVVNTGGEFDGFPEDLDQLVNEGTGKNIGLELTLERFMDKGFYYLLTTSIYDSKYKGSDGVGRNTAFNGNYVFNALAGKEFEVGRKKQNTIGVDIKATLMGGKRYIPINYEASQQQRQVVYNYADAYKDKSEDYFRADLKVSYNINKPKVTHQFILDIQNLSNKQNVFKENYNLSTGKFTTEYQTGLMPNIQYRILF